MLNIQRALAWDWHVFTTARVYGLIFSPALTQSLPSLAFFLPAKPLEPIALAYLRHIMACLCQRIGLAGGRAEEAESREGERCRVQLRIEGMPWASGASALLDWREVPLHEAAFRACWLEECFEGQLTHLLRDSFEMEVFFNPWNSSEVTQVERCFH